MTLSLPAALARATAAATTLVLVTAAAAAAAPWQTDTFDTGVIISYTATQSDAAEEYYLVVQCIAPDKWNIYVESPIDWEDDASYAPEVPATFAMDGAEISNVAFIFDDRSMTEGIVAYAKGQEAAFEGLLAAISGARGPIGLSYFDKRTSFSPEGSSAAIQFVKDACG